MKTLTSLTLLAACLLNFASVTNAQEPPDQESSAAARRQAVARDAAEKRLAFLKQRYSEAHESLARRIEALDALYSDTDDVAALLSDDDRSRLMAELLLKQMLLEADVEAAEIMKDRQASQESETTAATIALIKAKIQKTEIALQLVEKQLHVARQHFDAGHVGETKVDELEAKLRTLQVEHEALRAELEREDSRADAETDLQIISQKVGLETLQDQLRRLKASHRQATAIRLRRHEIDQQQQLLDAIAMKVLAAELALMDAELQGE